MQKSRPAKFVGLVPSRGALALCLVGLLSLHCDDDDSKPGNRAGSSGSSASGAAGDSSGGSGAHDAGGSPLGDGGNDHQPGNGGQGGSLAGAEGGGRSGESSGGAAGEGGALGGAAGAGGNGGLSSEGGGHDRGGDGGVGGSGGDTSECVAMTIVEGHPSNIDGRSAYAIDGTRDLALAISLSAATELTFEVRIPTDPQPICCNAGTCTAPLHVELSSTVGGLVADNYQAQNPAWEPRSLAMPAGIYTVIMRGEGGGGLCLSWPDPNLPGQAMPEPFYVSGLCLRPIP